MHTSELARSALSELEGTDDRDRKSERRMDIKKNNEKSIQIKDTRTPVPNWHAIESPDEPVTLKII